MTLQRERIGALLAADVATDRVGLAALQMAPQAAHVLHPQAAVLALGLLGRPSLLGVLLSVELQCRLQREPLGTDVAHPAGTETVHGLLVRFEQQTRPEAVTDRNQSQKMKLSLVM